MAMVKLLSLCFCTHFLSAPASPIFAFGDSYADTGNRNAHNPVLNRPWRPPYGLTWPGAPAGRFSDGQISTDFIAASLNISSPIPYQMWSHYQDVHSGVNFAFGGSGVFYTYGPEYPPVGAQIDVFHGILQSGVFSHELVASSLVLLVVAGNDYAVYTETHSDTEGLADFIAKVVEQIAIAVGRLYSLGLRKFAVSNLAPLGCLPASTSTTNYTACNELYNDFASLHNELLESHLSNLSKLPGTQFTTLDFYSAFWTSLMGATFRGEWSGDDESSRLQPCCQGVGNWSCGSVDSEGGLLYTVCSNPHELFFWDNEHPSQAGWRSVIDAVLPDLKLGRPHPVTFV